MSRRQLRTLTVFFLGLLIAAPLSSGDKGLWLSLAATPAHHLDVTTSRVPAEHTVMLPGWLSRIGRAATVTRNERPDLAMRLGPPGAAWALGARDRWTVVPLALRSQGGALFAARPAPRAPPA